MAPVWIHPAQPNLSTDPEKLPEHAYRQWQAIGEGERFALSGYAGAPVSALTDEEIRRELEWASKNPWGAGARLYGFDEQGASRAPSLPDPDRTVVGDYETFLLATFVREGREQLLFSIGGALRSLPLLRLTRGMVSFGRELSRFLRGCRRKQRPGLLFLEVDSAPGGVALLKEAVATVRESRSLLQRLRLAPFPADLGVPEADSLLTPALLERPLSGTPFDLSLHKGLRQAAAQRSLPGVNRERQRRILTAFRETQPQETRNRAYGSKRIYTAAMHGSAQIIGDSFSVSTEGGRPARLVASTSSVGVGAAAETTARYPGSYERVKEELCRVESVTAFSFESPLSRGIREESLIQGAITGRSTLDSFFISEYEELFIALELTLSGTLEEDILLTPMEFRLSPFESETTGDIALKRLLGKGRLLRDTLPLKQGVPVPLFGCEVTLEQSGSFPGVRCGSADLWHEALVPMAVGVAPGARRRRRGCELFLAPFGILRLRRGTHKEHTLRRTIRLSPFDEGGAFRRLTRELEEELLLWEGSDG